MDIEKIREDFPILQKDINGKPPVYFDNACMTLKPRQVVDAITQYYTEYSACHGRSVHRFSRQVTEKYNESRDKFRDFISAKRSEEIIFLRNTTEGINLISKSLSFDEGDVVATTDKEHNSNLIPWLRLKKEGKIEHVAIKSNDDNTFNMDNFEETLEKNNVRLVAMVHTSNLDGCTVPAEKIIKKAHRKGALVMLDGAQAVPHKEVNVRKLDVDFYAFSVHKMLGPTGTGILYGKKKLLEELAPFLVGGDTIDNSTYDDYELLSVPEKFEAGLQNYAGVIGGGAAVDYLNKINVGNIEKHEKELNRIVTDNLQDIDNIKMIGPLNSEERGGIFNFYSETLNAHDIGIILDESKNIMVRSGRHCVHSWFNDKNIDSSVRASFYIYNTEEEVKLFTETLREILKELL